MDGFKKAAAFFGLTGQEAGVILFLLGTLFIGSVIIWSGDNYSVNGLADYSESDSLYRNSARKEDNFVFLEKNTEKSVDSDQELFDFSGNKNSRSAGTGSERKPININVADKLTLTILPGIGEKTAEKIIDYRKLHGDFRLKEDIIKVKGIGIKKFEKIKDLISLE